MTNALPREPAQRRGWTTRPLDDPNGGCPPGEVIETAGSVVVQVALPGVDRDDIEVTIG